MKSEKIGETGKTGAVHTSIHTAREDQLLLELVDQIEIEFATLMAEVLQEEIKKPFPSRSA